MRESIVVCGVKVSPEEQTPAVERLMRIVMELTEKVAALEAENARLKGLPELPQRSSQASTLNDPVGKPSQRKKRKKKRRRGRRPGSKKRSKTKDIQIHQVVPVDFGDVPEDSVRAGFKDFVVQDLVLGGRNTLYRRARYRFSDGRIATAPLPADISSHFGPTLRSYVLYQHYQNHVTQPLLHEELQELGVDISTGQVNRLLTEGHDAFHQEKDALLPAAREVSRYFQTDDTGARHQGRSGHTLHIGNDLFASFFTTETKSRVNFLQILRSPHNDYVLCGDALFYMEYYGLAESLRRRLEEEIGGGDGCRVIEGDEAWQRQLDAWRIKSSEQQRIISEAALFGSLMAHDYYMQQPLLSDDAKQFKVLGLMHGLCWVHAERHVARLVPISDRQRKAQEKVRDEIWTYYQRLKAYRETPTSLRKVRLERDFEGLFGQRTGWRELNHALQKLHARKENLLLVLECPDLPLHNNLSENDIRQYVKKRKISAGTRSDLGRRCRDTFLSLKTTCRKLGVSFWRYLEDRIRGLREIPLLADAIRQKGTQPV